METFAAARVFVQDPGYVGRRARALARFDADCIDPPIRGLMLAFAGMAHCFTLQSCYGHFVHAGQPDPQSTEALPEISAARIGPVRYRIAYLAVCIENDARGRRLREALGALTQVDTTCVQFGSPDWFWSRHPNSYALQVEPDRFKLSDEAMVEHREALHLQHVRDEVFDRLREITTGCAS